VIASVAFQNFKALRNARLELRPFNLVIGPNGSGKTSLIQAVLQLRTLARLGPAPAGAAAMRQRAGGPEIVFAFAAPHAGTTARLRCVSDVSCDFIQIEPAGAADWPQLRAGIDRMRAYLFDAAAMARDAPAGPTMELAGNGANLAAVLATMQAEHPAAFAALQAELVRVMPEFTRIEFNHALAGTVGLAVRLRDEAGAVPAENLSQGTLYLLGMMVLAFHPDPPSVVGIEEIDRGIHPRMLREVRDLWYRLSHPAPAAGARPAVQVIATTHSPYLLDLFRDHPEEIVIAHKHGNAAHFAHLSDRGDLPELLAEGSLGDIWFSGILGGVPEE
jgi:predicted ATPase